MKILYNCMFPSFLYSCEARVNLDNLKKGLLLIERKALKACLGVKQGTPEDIIYVKINTADIISSIYRRQLNFIENLSN